MRNFLSRHKLVTRVLKSIVFLAALAMVSWFALTKYFTSQSTHIATVDRNSTAAISADLQAGKPVFLEACKPMCAQQLPEVDAAAQRLEGQVAFYQIDPEAEPDLMATVEQIVGQPIASYPAHIILTKTSRVITGAKSAQQLVDFIVQSTGLQLASPATAPASTGGGSIGAATPVPTYAYKNVTVVTADNLQQELQNVTTPVYIFLCNGHECDVQAEALDIAAGRYVGKIKFIEVDWFENQRFAAAIVRGAQMPLAFPIHVILSADGNILNYAAVVLQDTQIDQFISDAMDRQAQVNTANGTPQATGTPLPAAANTTSTSAAAVPPASSTPINLISTATPAAKSTGIDGGAK